MFSSAAAPDASRAAVVGPRQGRLIALTLLGVAAAVLWLAVPRLEERLREAADDATREGVLRDAGERLGIALAPVVGVLDLSEIVLSGPPELLGGPLAAATVDTLRARTLAPFHDAVRVRMTEQGEDIVLRGAAVMVLSGLLGVS